jgi:hypothetical protein
VKRLKHEEKESSVNFREREKRKNKPWLSSLR